MRDREFEDKAASLFKFLKEAIPLQLDAASTLTRKSQSMMEIGLVFTVIQKIVKDYSDVIRLAIKIEVDELVNGKRSTFSNCTEAEAHASIATMAPVCGDTAEKLKEINERLLAKNPAKKSFTLEEILEELGD